VSADKATLAKLPMAVLIVAVSALLALNLWPNRVGDDWGIQNDWGWPLPAVDRHDRYDGKLADWCCSGCKGPVQLAWIEQNPEQWKLVESKWSWFWPFMVADLLAAGAILATFWIVASLLTKYLRGGHGRVQKEITPASSGIVE